MTPANDMDGLAAAMARLTARASMDRELAARARRGDLEAMRLLHFGEFAWCELDLREWVVYFLGGVELRRIMDRHDAPVQRRQVRPGELDFFWLHSLALDRLDELLAFILPDGHEAPTTSGRWAWWGRHPQRPTLVMVCLLTGAWNEPNTGRAGRDLVSLYGHVFGVSAGRAFHMLSEFLDVDAVAYA